MSTEKDPFSMYLERLKAESTSRSLPEYKEHLTWAAKCRQLLAELRQSGFDFAEEIQVPVGGARGGNVSSIIRPDFVVTRDEIRLPIFLDVGANVGEIPTQSIRQYQRAFKSDPSVSGIVHCWRGDDIPSIALDESRLLKLELPQGHVVRFDETAPVKITISVFYERSFVGEWNVAALETLKVTKSTDTALSSLGSIARQEFDKFAKRRLRKPDHIEAQQLITARVLERLLATLRESVDAGERRDVREMILKIIREQQNP